MDYQVKFEVFEGPLDLLLHLIREEEVDIHEVSLTRLATEFIEYVDMMRLLDLEIAGEFLVMAATLMYIKSRELLPVDQQVTPEGEEEDTDDPRWELIRQLVEYKKFKDAAAQLQSLETRQDQVYPRTPARPEFQKTAPDPRGEVSIFELLKALNQVLKRMGPAEEQRDIFEDKWTVSEKIEEILQRLRRDARFRFSELFAHATSRTEVVVTFLALLELIRLRQLTVSQEDNFGEIEINQAEEAPEMDASLWAETPAAPAQPASAGNPVD